MKIIPLDEWHSLFNAVTEEDLDMLKSKTKNLGIIEAIKELKEISLTDRLRYERDLRLIAKMDHEAENDFVYKQGQEDGFKDGKKEGIKGSVNILRKSGYSDEQIIEALMAEYQLSRKDASGMI